MSSHPRLRGLAPKWCERKVGEGMHYEHDHQRGIASPGRRIAGERVGHRRACAGKLWACWGPPHRGLRPSTPLSMMSPRRRRSGPPSPRRAPSWRAAGEYRPPAATASSGCDRRDNLCAGSPRDFQRLNRQVAQRILRAVQHHVATGQGNVARLQGSRDELRRRVGAWPVRFTDRVTPGQSFRYTYG